MKIVEPENGLVAEPIAGRLAIFHGDRALEGEAEREAILLILRSLGLEALRGCGRDASGGIVFPVVALDGRRQQFTIGLVK